MKAIDILKNGACLISMSRICDLIKMDFLNEKVIVCLHVQSALVRGLKENELLLSSSDIFLPGKNYKKKLFKRFRWDTPGISLFDEQLIVFKNEILNRKINNVKFFGKDLILELDGNYKIEILPYTLEEGREFYRLFVKGELDSHIVVES